MKQLLEMIPIILFFVVYQMDGDTVTLWGLSHTIDGIYSATKILIVATLLTLPIAWLFERKLEKRHLWMSLAVLIFGGATLMFQSPLFIQWKPTLFNWAMALVFAVSQFTNKPNLLERLMGTQLELPSTIWRRICWVWIANFSIVGLLNLIVAYNFSEATWVSYKLYSAIGFTLLIVVITTLMIGPSLKSHDVKTDISNSKPHP